MRRIVVIASSMAGVTCATRIKRRSPEEEVNLIIPSFLDTLSESTGPVSAYIAKSLPNTELLATRDVSILKADTVTPDLLEKTVMLASTRGSLPVRYTDLVVEVTATPRLPRLLRQAGNVFTWPMPGFTPHAAACDAALADSVAAGLPVVVVGGGTEGLEAVLLAREAGAKVHWLRPDEPDALWVEPYLEQRIMRHLSPDVTLESIPAGATDLVYSHNDNGNLRLISCPDGTAIATGCCLWAANSMGNHPLLREEGITLDKFGRMTLEEENAPDGVFLIGTGAAIPSAFLSGSAIPVPQTPGGTESALAHAAYLAEHLSGSLVPFPGALALRKALAHDMTVYRAGFTLAGAEYANLQAEHATLALPVANQSCCAAGTTQGSMHLCLICDKQTRTLLGVQALGLNAPESAVAGLFSTVLAALADGVNIDTLALREGAGISGRMVVRCASMLRNKLTGKVKGITPDEFLASAKAGAEFFILDLRSKTEWERRRLPGAYNIPLPQLHKRLQDEVPRFTPLVLVCATANDSFTVACKLAGLGATELYVLDGGMDLWSHPTEGD